MSRSDFRVGMMIRVTHRKAVAEGEVVRLNGTTITLRRADGSTVRAVYPGTLPASEVVTYEVL